MAVGKAVKRLDGVAKVTGMARYTDDMPLPGMREAMYLRSSIAHGRVKSIDVSQAKALPGVDGVFTFEDVPRHKFSTAGHPHIFDPHMQDVMDRRLLTGHVRYMGDEIAVVVAKDKLCAKRALKLIRVEYEEYAPMVKPEDALAKDARRVHGECENNLVQSGMMKAGDDPEGAMRESARHFEGSYETQVQAHCHLENHTAYAYMDDLEKIVVVSSTQIPHLARRLIGRALDIPAGQIRVIKPYIGGGFGAKQDMVLEAMVAFLTSKLGGIPVRLRLGREECMIGTRVRHPFKVGVKLGISAGGDLGAIELDVLANTGGYSAHGHAIAPSGAPKVHYLYPRAAFKCRTRSVYSNIPDGGAMRGYGSPQMTWAIECAMEDAARSLGRDPLEFRKQNVCRQGDFNHLAGNRFDTCGLLGCLDKGQKLIGWDQKRAERLGQTGPIRRGLGVACFAYASGIYPYAVEIGSARLVLNPDGSMLMQVGATEIGQGSDTVLAQMAAEILGVETRTIKVASTQDTDLSPFDLGAYASRQVYVTGQAVVRAAKKLKTKILAHAGLMSGHSAQNLTIAGNDVVTAIDPNLKVASLGEVALDAYYEKDRGGQITAEDSYKTRTNARTFGCTFVDLEVDIPLCRVRIREIYNIHDAGRVMNPQLAAGQVHGGLAMGIGAALFEELLIDQNSGRIPNNNLLDYKIPTIMDIPDLGADFVETLEPSHPLGAKSLGEPPALSPPPAIRNAILDATGVALNRLPMSPENLFKEFKAAELI
jgi:xanthine dehydrogenase molybdenum-binding subunit